MGKASLIDRINSWADGGVQENRAMREAFGCDGVTNIDDAQLRSVVRLRGTLRTMTLCPRGGIPVLEAELVDGSSHTVTIIWLGRRHISGVTPGRNIEVEGRLSNIEGHLVMYNPRYDLMPS